VSVQWHPDDRGALFAAFVAQAAAFQRDESSATTG
jgi:hypothetical protein